MARKKLKYISRTFASYCVLLNNLIKVVITHIFIAKNRINMSEGQCKCIHVFSCLWLQMVTKPLVVFGIMSLHLLWEEYSVFMSKTVSFMSKSCQVFFLEIKEKYFQTLNVVCIRPISAWKSSAAASMMKELLWWEPNKSLPSPLT